MAEQLDLTTPVTLPMLTHWRVFKLQLVHGVLPIDSIVGVTLRGTNGELFVHTYAGITAQALLTFLNTANLSTQSLERRVLARLIADGVLSGTISGSPD